MCILFLCVKWWPDSCRWLKSSWTHNKVNSKNIFIILVLSKKTWLHYFLNLCLLLEHWILLSRKLHWFVWHLFISMSHIILPWSYCNEKRFKKGSKEMNVKNQCGMVCFIKMAKNSVGSMISFWRCSTVASLQTGVFLYYPAKIV